MQKFFKNAISLFGITVLLLLFNISFASANSISAPSLLKINSFKAYSLNSPVISGVSMKGTNVLVFIDGIFSGNAVIQESESVTNSFYFQAFGLDEGLHDVYLVAEDTVSLDRSIASESFQIEVSGLPAPTLVVPNEETITGFVKPVIEGFTRSGTFVHLYIDGVYNGKTNIVEHESMTAHFAYRPFLNLEVGEHKMWAVSEDEKGRKSKVSKVVEFNIERKMPAPTLFTPVVNNRTTLKKPFIVGLSKNDANIKLFVDHKVVSDFEVSDHVSGTTNFAVAPNMDLSDGDHFVYAVAVDNRGKESIWSNVVYFSVGEKQIPSISGEAVSEDEIVEVIVTEDGLKVIEENEISQEDKNINRLRDYLIFASLYNNDKQVRLSDAQYSELTELLKDKKDLGLTDAELASLEELENSKEEKTGDEKVLKLDDVVKEETKTDSEELGGPINEDKEQQSKLGLNAIIFLAFLLAVIAWIFWVNRELIKEKKEQEEREANENK